MAITRAKKQEMLSTYLDQLSHAQMIVVADYRGLKVKEIQQLRRALAEHQATFQVVKNTLIKRALAEAGWPVPDDLLEGPTAIGYCSGDLAATSKAFVDFAKQHETLKIRGGILDGKVIDDKAIQALADLPPREVLLAQVLAGMQSPISGLVNVLAGTLRGLVNVLDAYRRKLEESAA